MLNIKNLNTTASHPQCDGAVKRFNQTLKAMLRKQVSKYGRNGTNAIHPTVQLAKSHLTYLLFGFDRRFPTKAALLPATPINATDISDYQELAQSSSFARDLAMKTSQRCYKGQYDKTAKMPMFQIGDLVVVHFAQEETGKMKKLSQPWHGLHRIVSRDDPEVTVKEIYFPDDPQIQVRVPHLFCKVSFGMEGKI